MNANSRRCRLRYICLSNSSTPILQFLLLLFLEGLAVQFIILYTVGIKKTRFYCYVNRNFSVTRNWDGTHAVGTLETFFQEKTAKRQADARIVPVQCVFTDEEYIINK